MTIHEFTENTPVQIEVYDYKTRSTNWIGGRVLSVVTAIDRPYRITVEDEQGRVFRECAPECVKLVTH